MGLSFKKLNLKKLKLNTMHRMAASASTVSTSPWFTYLMVAVLIAILAFAVVYIANVQQKSSEMFTEMNPNFKVVYVYSNSCGFCTRFAPTYDSWSSSLSGSTTITPSKCEKSQPCATAYMPYVTAFPTILIFDQNDKMIQSNTGSLSLTELKNFVKNNTT